MPLGLLWTTPNPRFGAEVELFCGYPCGQLDLPRIGEALSCQGFAPKQPPPRFLEVEPARPHWDEDLLHPRVLLQPLSDGWTLVARKVVGDQVKVAGRVCLGNRFEQPQVTFGVARGSGERESLAVSHPQRTIYPDLLRATAILQRRLDAMGVWRPARRRREGARAYWTKLIQADDTRVRCWVGVELDYSRPFGANSGSSLSAHDRAFRHRTPSALRIRLTWLRPTTIPRSRAAVVSASSVQ
jgi:hypothetical protein